MPLKICITLENVPDVLVVEFVLLCIVCCYYHWVNVDRRNDIYWTHPVRVWMIWQILLHCISKERGDELFAITSLIVKLLNSILYSLTLLDTYLLSMVLVLSAPSTLLWFHSLASTAAAATHMMLSCLPLVWRPLSPDFRALCTHFNCKEFITLQSYVGIQKMYLRK